MWWVGQAKKAESDLQAKKRSQGSLAPLPVRWQKVHTTAHPISIPVLFRRS